MSRVSGVGIEGVPPEDAVSFDAFAQSVREFADLERPERRGLMRLARRARAHCERQGASVERLRFRAFRCVDCGEVHLEAYRMAVGGLS